MKLADLRKLSIKKNLKIRFVLQNGMECVITEHGVAQVPALRRVPDFNLEQELASIGQFVLEPVPAAKKPPAPARTITRDKLAAMSAPTSSATASDHEDE